MDGKLTPEDIIKHFNMTEDDVMELAKYTSIDYFNGALMESVKIVLEASSGDKFDIESIVAAIRAFSATVLVTYMSEHVYKGVKPNVD